MTSARSIIVLALLSLLTAFSFASEAAEATRTVVDRNGRSVAVPVDPKRIACFFGPSYEKIFLLGSGDRVAAMSIKQTPWAHKLNPLLKKAVVMPSYNDPDVERLLQLAIDLVFYWQWPQQTQKMAAAGIPVVCPYDGGRSPASREEFMRRYKEEIRFYGEVLGEKATKIAEAYCGYYDQKMNRTLSVTSKIPANQRPTVYYITGRNAFATQGGYSLAYWLTDMAGGNLVSKDLSPGFVDVSMEQIIAWNPEVIVVGGLIPADSIMNDPRWKSIRAVKEKRVYTSPEGVFLWSHGSSEVHLFVMWLARTLHPDKFQDVDLAQETIDYYARFYHHKLTTDEAQRILKRLPPTG